MNDRLSDSIDLRSERIFPFQFQLIGIVFLIGGTAFIPSSLYIGVIILVIGIFILTGYRGIQFKRNPKMYRTYYSFFFIKFGDWDEYGDVEMIYVNSGKVSQKVYTRITEGSTIRNIEYNAYLLFSSGRKEFLITGKKKAKVMARLVPLSRFFDLDIIDNTV